MSEFSIFESIFLIWESKNHLDDFVNRNFVEIKFSNVYKCWNCEFFHNFIIQNFVKIGFLMSKNVKIFNFRVNIFRTLG